MKQISFLFSVFGFSVLATGQVYEGDYYLSTQWFGQDKVLSAEANGQLRLMDKQAKNSNQIWRIKALAGGFFELSNRALGLSLDVVNDGQNNKLHLVKSARVSGQAWRFTPAAFGFYWLSTQWQGESKTLDVINGGNKDRVHLTNKGNFSGQNWKFCPVLSEERQNTVRRPSFPTQRQYGMLLQEIEGFKVYTNPKYAEEKATWQAIYLIEKQLKELPNFLREEHLNKLRNIPIWIEFLRREEGMMWYHVSADWLTKNGYIAEMEKSVEVSNVHNLLAWQHFHPYIVLHELAHGYHDLYMSQAHKKRVIQAYEQAKAGGKYEKVAHISGTLNHRHYALTNEKEYFSELTEAYFGKNNYFPFTRKDLEKFDPLGYALVAEIWA